MVLGGVAEHVSFLVRDQKLLAQRRVRDLRLTEFCRFDQCVLESEGIQPPAAWTAM